MADVHAAAGCVFVLTNSVLTHSEFRNKELALARIERLPTDISLPDELVISHTSSHGTHT